MVAFAAGSDECRLISDGEGVLPAHGVAANTVERTLGGFRPLAS